MSQILSTRIQGSRQVGSENQAVLMPHAPSELISREHSPLGVVGGLATKALRISNGARSREGRDLRRAREGALDSLDRNLRTRLVPHNLEAEQALLGAILIKNETLGKVSEFLDAHHFYDQLHQQIYSTASALIVEGRRADPLTLRAYFENAEPVDGTATVPQYLGKLAANAATTINAPEYARTVFDLATRRHLILIGEDISNAAYDAPIDFPPEQQIEEAERRLNSLAAVDQPSGAMFADDIPVSVNTQGPIEGLIGAGSLGVWFGPSGAGKTTVVLDAVHAIANGKPWMGRETTQGAVLYVVLEGRNAFGARLEAARRRYGQTGKRLLIVDKGITLDRAGGPASVSRILREAKDLVRVSEMPVRLIVIDTYARALAGDDENDAATASAVLHHLDKVARETGAAVLLIHHPGKEAGRGPRGSNALYGAADNVIEIEREGQSPLRTIVARKLREGPEGPIGAFTLETVEVGQKANGTPITACSILPEDASHAKSAIRRPKAGSAADRAHRELTEIICAGKCTTAVGTGRAPKGAPVVVRDEWRAACRARKLTGDGSPDSERRAFNRAIQELSHCGLIGEYGDDVWLISGTRAEAKRAAENVHV